MGKANKRARWANYRRRALAKTNKHVQLADTYLRDGAPAGAARCLRQAADVLDRLAAYRLKMMMAE